MIAWEMAAWCALASGMLPVPDDGAWNDVGSVSIVHDALRARTHLPWYDAEGDVLRRLDVRPRGDDERRGSAWATERAAPDDALSDGSRSFVAQVMRVAAWFVLGGLLAGLVWALTRAGWHRDRASVQRDRGAAPAAPAVRLEGLPPVTGPDDRDLLEAAGRCHAAGDYGRAIVLLYAHQLQQLDRHHLIRLAKGKTNRQYLSELRGQARLREILTGTVRAFEESYFGHYVLSRAQFEACWAHLDEFHRQLESAT